MPVSQAVKPSVQDYLPHDYSVTKREKSISWHRQIVHSILSHQPSLIHNSRSGCTAVKKKQQNKTNIVLCTHVTQRHESCRRMWFAKTTPEVMWSMHETHFGSVNNSSQDLKVGANRVVPITNILRSNKVFRDCMKPFRDACGLEGSEGKSNYNLIYILKGTVQQRL